MLKLLRTRLLGVPLVALLVVSMLGIAFPVTAKAENLGRTLGGAAGVAAGSLAGAALASAIIGAAGIASWGPLATILVGTAITAGGAFLGAKLISHLGLTMDRALGPGSTWMLVGAIAGTVAAMALIPALGPFAGPAGMIAKALIGGVVGGVLGKLFAPWLESHATPRTIYAAMGGLIGGLGFGIPGAVAGVAGGYALGMIFGDNFFADEDRYTSDYVDDARDWFDDIKDRAGDWRDTISDWFGGKSDRLKDWASDNWHEYDYYDGSRNRWDRYTYDRNWGYQPVYSGGYQQYPYAPSGSYGQVEPYRQDYYDQMRQFQELNSRGGSHRERYEALERLRSSQERYRGAVGSGYGW